MNIFSNFLIMGLFGIVLFIIVLLIRKKSKMTKNEKDLIGNGIGALYSIFLMEYVLTALSPGRSVEMSLYTLVIYYFSRFVLSLALISKNYNNVDTE